jgi:hypothetical protein
VTSSSPNYSSALGDNNLSNGQYSFIGGSNSEATGARSFGFGQYVTSSGSGSFALGYSVLATAENSWIIGKGPSNFGSTFVNNIPNSFMIGFNTSVPSFFVQTFVERVGGGFVGIHTTTPRSELDVNGLLTTNGFRMPQLGLLDGWVLTYDATLDKAVWAQPLGGGSGGSSPWLTSGTNVYYNGGNVGIGLSNPTEKLHVVGNILNTGNILSGGYANLASYLNADGFIRTNSNLYLGGQITINNSTGVLNYGKANEISSFQIKRYKSGDMNNGKSDDPLAPYWKNVLVIDDNENIGIGTDTPTANLDVNGTIKTTQFAMTSGAGANKVLQSDANGNASWVDPGSFAGSDLWSEDANGNIYRESGNVGIGTGSPTAPLSVGFGNQTVGLKFTGVNYGSPLNYSDFNIETNFKNSKPELSFKTTEDNARYVWACNGVDKMTLDMVYYGDPGATILKLHDGRIETSRFKIQSIENVEGFILQADADGDATWVEPEEAGFGMWNSSETNADIFRLSGNVGIGTTATANAKLTVRGKIIAMSMDITEDVPASDYVFEEDYKLMPLNELEAYVTVNKHLPEVKSAQEFKENGYNIGQMDDVLLRKIEELTLYVIEQQKMIDELRKDLKKQSENK